MRGDHARPTGEDPEVVVGWETSQDRSTPERREEIPIRRNGVRKSRRRIPGKISFAKFQSVEIDLHGECDRGPPWRKREKPQPKPIPIEATTGP